MTPCLRSPRLILTPYTPMLVTEQHVGWLNDKELMEYSEQRHHIHDYHSQRVYAGGHHPHRHLWLIRCNGKDIGSLSAHLDKNNNHANLGILIGSREHQGQGFAAEAWCTVIDWLFENGCHKIECGTRADNWRMRNLATKTGFQGEGKIPQHFRVGDKYVDLILYGRFKADVYHSEWDKMGIDIYWHPREG